MAITKVHQSVSLLVHIMRSSEYKDGTKHKIILTMRKNRKKTNQRLNIKKALTKIEVTIIEFSSKIKTSPKS